MNESLVAANLRTALVEALRLHHIRAKQPWSGVYHFEEQNRNIGRIILLIDPFLRATKHWPEEKRYIGNRERLRLLEQAARKTTT